MNDLHGILFAYHSDSNLGELTRPRNTCSLPFGGRYRLIDFMLSSYVNAGISDVGLIVHESYQSLLDHVGSGKDWDLSRKHGGLRILPPFGCGRAGRQRGIPRQHGGAGRRLHLSPEHPSGVCHHGLGRHGGQPARGRSVPAASGQRC